jgi:tetratricopeptide (TPR) repeat protein
MIRKMSLKKFRFFLGLLFSLFAQSISFGLDNGYYFYKGAEDASQGKFAEAREAFRDSLKNNERDYDLVAQSALEQMDAFFSGKLNKEAIIHCFKAVLDHKQGNLQEAIAEMDKSISLEPNYFDYYYKRGTLYAMQGNFDNSITDFNIAIKLNPKRAELYYYQGNNYMGKGDVDKAIYFFTETIKVDPQYGDAYFNRGVAYRHKNVYDKAFSDIDKSIQLQPNAELAHLQRGDLYLMLNNVERAISDYTREIEINSPNTNVSAYIKRACAFAENKNYAKALDDLDKAESLARANNATAAIESIKQLKEQIIKESK